MTMEDFLKKYYRQMHFNAMSPEVRARFDGYVAKDSLTRTMRIWRDDYMHLDPSTRKYVQNEIPDTTKEEDLPDDVARELFVACQNAFVSMNGKLATFEREDPLSAAFVRRYFGDGPGKLFNISKAKPECEKGIKEIVDLIRSNETIKNWLLLQKGDDDKLLFSDPTKLEDFLKKCDKKEYNTKGGAQDKVRKVAKVFFDASTHAYGLSEKMQPITQLEYLENVISADAFSMDPGSIDPAKLQEFRKNIRAKNPRTGEENKTGILQVLYRSKTIRDQFAKHDNGAITGVISGAEDKIDYQKTDSANYVSPKIEDTKTPLQWLEKWKTDTYKDTLQKYEDFRGAPLFFFPESSSIFKAIDKAKIKQTDGLNKLIEKEADVKKELADEPLAKEHFEWFINTMKEVEKDIPKAIEGAWQDASQMQDVITRIILKAADPNIDDPDAVTKAMTAMEIMNAMKFGMLTGKLVDAIKQTEFSIFSNGDLSWNKNEAIKFMTGALDKSIKFAFVGLGYGVTFIKNGIKLSRRNGSRYTDEDNQQGPLGELWQDQKTKLNQQNTVDKRSLKADLRQARADKQAHKQTLEDLKNNDGINGRTIRAKERDVEAFKVAMGTHQAGEDKYQEADKALAEMDPELKNMWQEIKDLKKEIDITLPTQIKEAEVKYKSPMSYPDDMPETKKEERRVELYDKWQNLQTSLEQKKQKLIDKRAEYTSRMTAFTKMRDQKNANTASHDLYEDNKTKHDALKAKTDAFRAATAGIKEKTATIKKQRTALNNWDVEHVNKIEYLQKFWNHLQTGDTKTFSFSTKRAQGKFDLNKAAILQQLALQNGLAA